MPERLRMCDVVAARFAETAQQGERKGVVAAAVHPERGVADAHLPRQLTRRTGTQLQPSDQLLQRVARSGIELPQFFEPVRADTVLLAEGDELLQDTACRRVDAQLQIADTPYP